MKTELIERIKDDLKELIEDTIAQDWTVATYEGERIGLDFYKSGKFDIGFETDEKEKRCCNLFQCFVEACEATSWQEIEDALMF